MNPLLPKDGLRACPLSRLLAAGLALVSVLALPARAAQLGIADGVVVKFGPDTQLVVRDRMVFGSGITLTSQGDDQAGGPTGTAAGVAAAAGDWRGMRIEKSVAGMGAFALNDVTLRYAETALTLRGLSPGLNYLQFTGNGVGLRLLDAASPAIVGASFVHNATAIEAGGGSAPSIAQAQFVGNSAFAVTNQTPASVIQATGNWWGHASGPRQSARNPQGQGDAVSEGVNFSGHLTGAPLLNPVVRLAAPAPYFDQHTVLLDLSCVNATQYRVAQGEAFVGVPFAPLPGARAQVAFVTSEGDGRKPISVQYRNASGTVVSARLAQDVWVDRLPPVVALTNPAAGSVIGQSIAVQASASDGSSIAQVQFFVDDALVATRSSSPYSYQWDTQALAEGLHSVKAVATDQAGRSSEHSVQVTLARTPPPQDTQGPVIADVRVDGRALANGTELTRSASLTASVSDRSGVARVQLLFDGVLLATASASGSSGNYTAPIPLDTVPNGAHTLALRALDSVGNETSASYAISLAHAAPDAPVLSQPSHGLTTRHAGIVVAGSAQPGSRVQLLVNGRASGGLITVAGDGRFSRALTLLTGTNQLQATAANTHGTSAASPAIVVHLDTTVPATPAGLSASAQVGGKLRLTWARATDPQVTGYHIYRAATAFSAIGEAVRIDAAALAATATSHEDQPPSDGLWFYRVVAVNRAGTVSEPSNAAQAASDATPPRALSIVYASQGKTDPATGRTGQGAVALTLTTSEALQSIPYLSIVPMGGAPIPVALSRTSDTVYRGDFSIGSHTPSGLAHALFSARDMVGNRGTDVDIGATLKIDTEGPALSSIVLTPAAPIRNDSAQTVQARFGFSKAPAAPPRISYLLSGPLRSPVPVSGLTRVDANTYSASFVLPADAGLSAPESLGFGQQSRDDLDNQSTRVVAFNRFQVYQGDLPPLAVPLAFAAKAQAVGRVRLSWQAVEQASSYQIYRQAPGATGMQPLTRTGGIDYIDQTPADGSYRYAIATVRQSNGQESVSGQSAAVQVHASATAPGAPQNLTLRLTGQGIYASWHAPLSSTVDHYRLYRAGGTGITSIEGLSPYKSRIKTPQTYDTSPSPTQGAYVVTALDEAGNESAISNGAYLNASLLPVRNLSVEQIGSDLPVIRWNAPNSDVAGYLVYVGTDANQTRLTPQPISATTLTDTGYTAGERRYTIATVDANDVQMARSISLPSVSSQIVSGLPIQRGVMNRLQVQVTNTSASTIDGARAVVRLPVNRQATQFREHKSAPFELAPNQTRLIPVIVGGHAGLPDTAQAQVGLEIAPVEGERVHIARHQMVDVTEGAMVVGLSTEEFTRGATGKLRITVENRTEVDVELLTATNHGADASSELRLKILDVDGNLLATQAYRQPFGANVVTLSNGQTVARIAAGSNHVSDVFLLNVPLASPERVRVKLEVDKLRYHSGQDDEVQIAGRGSEKTVSLQETDYSGEVTDISPVSSYGEQDVVITGRALNRASQAPQALARLKLILNQQGFERIISVVTDGSGNFTHRFAPTATDAGLYKVSAVHPAITDRPEQKSFTINRVTVGPTPLRLDVPKNYPFSIALTAQAGPATTATNLRLSIDPARQPTGQIPAGISVQLPSPVSLTQHQRLNLPVLFTASNDAQPSGSLILTVTSDEHAATPVGLVRVNYTLSEATPYLVSTPTLVETGLAQGASQVESVSVRNSGLQDAIGLRFTLTRADGSPAPAWAGIASQADGTLGVGQTRSIDLAFTPPAATPEGIHEFRLHVVGENVPAQSLNIYVSLTQSGQGHVLFKVADMYTATVDRNGQLIAGLAGASITVQNEDVLTVTRELSTDALGEALLQNLPSGRYKFRAKAVNHQEASGRLLIRPGITANQSVFLDYNLINVEWSVREITIEDRYDITINASFETDVPAAVVVLHPASVNLPRMAAGDVHYGELSLTNHGLVRADNIRARLPQSDAHFRFEFLANIPSTLQARQRVTIPYRITALQALGEPAGQRQSSDAMRAKSARQPTPGSNPPGDGGCYNYSNTLAITYDYTCANGTQSTCGSATSWFSSSNRTCGAGNGGGGGTGGGGGSAGISGPGGVGGFGGGSSSTPIRMKGKKCVFVPGIGRRCQ
ncbi:Ig-like domain-containing protein [Verminephrobacter eiseniae]|uniref:Ig-like domain-containing protein n=1 Tax=Verminephrobacter eiseniae TaxID=364317 RepID=UPI002237AA7F|nr:Ig-like domain-containing protein [Verminephrobacter eiseniae]